MSTLPAIHHHPPGQVKVVEAHVEGVHKSVVAVVGQGIEVGTEEEKENQAVVNSLPNTLLTLSCHF